MHPQTAGITPFDLRQCVYAAIDVVMPRARQKRLLIVSAVDPHLPSSVLGDPIVLRAVLVELLTNAVTFTTGGEVVVAVTAAPRRQMAAGSAREEGADIGRIEFAVRDTGIGMTAERKARLREYLAGIDGAPSDVKRGPARGLAGCIRLLKTIRGRLSFESQIGRGSTFRFTIEGRPVDAGAPQVRGPEFAGSRLLLLDPQPETRAVLQQQLTSAGLTVTSVSSRSDALKCVQLGERFNMVVVVLGQATAGSTDLDEIAHEWERTSVPIVVLTPPDTLPASVPRGATVLESPIPLMIFLDYLRHALGSQPHDPATQTPAVANLHSAPALKILVAEDDAVNQQVALRVLVRMGHHVDLVASGRDALRAIEHHNYDVVLMDTQMPDMSGLDVTAQIRRTLPHRRPWIIALSAGTASQDHKRSVHAGADDCLAKPIRRADLLNALQYVVRRQPS